MLLGECVGFHPRAVDVWTDLKYGYEYAGLKSEADPDSSSCYICYDPATNSSEAAVRSWRALQLLDKSAELSMKFARSFIVLLDSSALSNKAMVCDILGGMIFRSADDFLIVPPLSDHATFVNELTAALATMSVPDLPAVHKVFPSLEEATKVFQTVVGLTLIRDLHRVYGLDKRACSEDVAVAISGMLSQVVPLSEIPNDLSNEALLNAQIDRCKPLVSDRALQESWELEVQSMYERPSPPRVRRTPRTRGIPDDRRSTLRSREGRRSFAHLDESEDDELEDMQDLEQAPPTLVVENWLQCDKCSKWRLVDSKMAEDFADKTFECADIPKFTCNDASDDHDALQL